MRTRGGCGLVVLGALFALVGCLICAALAWALVLVGEIPLYAPRPTRLEPDPNHAFRPTTPITLSFDQPMDPASVEAAFALEPAVPGTFQWSEDDRQVTFVPVGAGFQPGQTYTVRLAAGAKAGTLPRTTANPLEWGFSLPPLLDEQQPPPGQEGLGPWPILEVAFNYPLDCAATSDAFSISPEAAGSLACHDYTLTFSPTLPLLPDTTYVAALENVYLPRDPTPRPGVRWQFRTASPLKVEEVSPAEADPLVDLWTPFRITFNRPVVVESAATRFSLVSEDGSPLAGELVWEQEGASLVFRPAEALAPGSGYQLRLEPGVEDGLGFELGEAVDRSYQTLPMLGSPQPAPGARDVALDSAIRVPFTRPMDKASAEAGLTIAPDTRGKVVWEENTLVFTPRGGLAPETTYQLALAAEVRDASGAPLTRSQEWEFGTQPFLLEAKVPGDQPLSKLQQPLEFTFALPMDPASVRAALTISPTTPGELVWSDDGRSVTFQPEPGWLPAADYEVTISGSARTADGLQRLGEERNYAYATSVAEVQFGDGPNVQVMDVDGEGAFQVVARGADLADFCLYPITPTQFLNLYSSGPWGVGPPERPAVDTSVLTPTVEWRGLLTPLGDEMYEGWLPAEANLPPGVAPGLYLLSTEPPSDERGELLLGLSRHALVLKEARAGSGDRGRSQVLAWDTEIQSGAPVISATVRLYDREGSVLAEGLTDDQGLVTLETPGDPGPVLALSEKEGDVAVAGLGSGWSEAGWWGWWAPVPSRPLYLTYSYTDRPIYRPAQTVYFKDWVRADDDVSYTLPSPDLPVTVRLRDARDNVAATQVLTLTQFGTLHGEFPLADEPVLGTWNLETEVDGETTRQPFQVEEYRKPEYQVVLHTPRQAYVLGEVISLTVLADYYFGQPVAGAEVVLLAYPLFAGDLYQVDQLQFGAPLYRQEGRTDDQGRWTVIVPSEELYFDQQEGQRAVLALEATVTDEVGQGVSSYQTIIVQPAGQAVTLVLERYGYRPGEEIPLAALVRDRDNQPVTGTELRAQVLGWDGAEVAAATAATDRSGRADLSLRLEDQGWYQVKVSGTDTGGRPVEASDYLWIYDPEGRAPWYVGHAAEGPALRVAADRPAYAVGEEAQLAILSPVAGPALLTFERGRTHYAEPVALISGTNLISVPVRASYAPNIYITVNQFGPAGDAGWVEQSQPEGQLQLASTELLVPMAGQRLTVTLSTDRDVYAPGDEATFEVQVTDHEGQPVVAEVSLAVVDEAIYALAEDLSRDPFEVFYGPRPNLVRTYDSLRPTRWLYPGGPGLGGDGEAAGEAPRRSFLDTAYWAPAAVTDENGGATLTFELPDNLTQWRALARAVTTDTLAGQATARLAVTQDIVLRPALPRFLTQGDALTLTTVLHNFTGQPLSATLQLDLDGLVLEGDAEQVLHLPAGGSATGAWPVSAEQAGEALITIQATASRGARLAGRDAVEMALPVYPLAVPEVATWAAELTPLRPTETITLSLPADLITDTGSLEIHLSSSLASGLLPGLEYLIDYPYGCVEQTMSRMLPNAMVARAFRQLGVGNERLEADLPAMMDLGLGKLYGFQHDDGGWGWWYDDNTDLNQTSYVLFGLAMAEGAGFDVDDGVLERGAEALRRLLPGADPRAQPYGVFALAAVGQPFSVTLTLTETLNLDLFSQAALAVAMDTAGPEAALSGAPPGIVETLLDNLREAAIQDATTVHWEESADHVEYSRTVMGSTVRTTAIVMQALLRLDPESPLLPRAARWLMEQRQGRGWGDTQRTSYALLTLTDYFLVSAEQAGSSAFRVSLNGEPWQEGLLAPLGEGQLLTLPVAALSPGENFVGLALGVEGEAPAGRLFYAATLSLLRDVGEAGIPALQTQERSIGVQREYRVLGDSRPGEMATFRQGDLVEVRLTLDVPEESWYVVIDDPLPAGLEALNERLGTTSHVAGTYESPVYHWEEYGYNRKEVRDEGVALFVTHLNPGQQTYTYMTRATGLGSFTALPTQVYPMYEPEVWSRSDSARHQIEMP